ncbi:hypothetical protein INR49_003076 [Caranx melampygus]|nr:hypothetical protein INR49_003076 [Caranx melampygus]
MVIALQLLGSEPVTLRQKQDWAVFVLHLEDVVVVLENFLICLQHIVHFLPHGHLCYLSGKTYSTVFRIVNMLCVEWITNGSLMGPVWNFGSINWMSDGVVDFVAKLLCIEMEGISPLKSTGDVQFLQRVLVQCISVYQSCAPSPSPSRSHPLRSACYVYTGTTRLEIELQQCCVPDWADPSPNSELQAPPTPPLFNLYSCSMEEPAALPRPRTHEPTGKLK